MSERSSQSRSGRPQRLGYLSAAPTVSTRNDAISAGPRAHILGVIQGFEAAGFTVNPFIVGDQLAPSLGKSRIQGILEASKIARYAGDAARLLLGRRNAGRAFDALIGEVDWVYERFATMQVLGRRFKHAGIPWILETQGLFYYETQTERQNVGSASLAKAVEIAAYRDCDALICISEPLKTLLIEECGIAPDKIFVVPNAVDLSRFTPAGPAASPAPRRDHLTLVFVGGLIEWQALDLLLTALAELRDQGLIIDLRVVGTGAMLKPWQALTNQLGLQDQIQFLGHVAGSDVPAEIAAADLGYAGAKIMAIGAMYHSPIKLYEYMAMAKPVLAAAHDDAKRLVQGQDTGFLFAPENQADLKRCLQQAAASRVELSVMGQKARALIEAEHSWTVRTAGMIASLDDYFTRQESQSLPLLATPATGPA